MIFKAKIKDDISYYINWRKNRKLTVFERNNQGIIRIRYIEAIKYLERKGPPVGFLK